MTLSYPPQRAQAWMSMPNTRFKRFAQLIATFRGVAGLSALSCTCGFLPSPRPAGVTAASRPWLARCFIATWHRRATAAGRLLPSPRDAN
jgi:hypothetical protein